MDRSQKRRNYYRKVLDNVPTKRDQGEEDLEQATYWERIMKDRDALNITKKTEKMKSFGDILLLRLNIKWDILVDGHGSR